MKIDSYQLLDSGNLRKLEQVGRYRLIRPALNAFWKPSLPEKEWLAADAEFIRDSSGHGSWRNRSRIPDQWSAVWGEMTMRIKPTNFGVYHPLLIYYIGSLNDKTAGYDVIIFIKNRRFAAKDVKMLVNELISLKKGDIIIMT